MDRRVALRLEAGIMLLGVGFSETAGLQLLCSLLLAVALRERVGEEACICSSLCPSNAIN